MIRSRPYLYDKSVKSYKDATMKENAWTEIANVLDTTVTECQNRWTRLRQCFSKERQLQEQETRSGAGKPMRQKWILFESLAFLGRHITHRRSFSNVNCAKPSGPSGISEMALKTQHSRVLQDKHEMTANNNLNTPPSTSGQQSLHTLLKIQHSRILQDKHEMTANNNLNTPLSTSGQQSLYTLPSKEVCNTLPKSVYENQSISNSKLGHDLRPPSPLQSLPPLAVEETSLSSTSSSISRQTPASETEETNVVSPPSSCFSGNMQRTFKKQKINPVEIAFHQMNNTLSNIAEVCSRKKPVNDNDPDVVIGKLVTAELQTATEPYKSELKRKFMELLYFSKTM
ncbi:hypothetical protein DBV15_10921 [Temnothorax longispinosus]|uniref:MADF domain-containing protein n=2 Tax=Temnothorax longispinosus TaxID=300112 RepID=A0A4S2JC46_9HYME|nr:hypothetical protein DBV15_10921 [Temnothorax longispinosus]